MADLASKMTQQIQSQGKEWTKAYLDSAQEALNEDRISQRKKLTQLTQDIELAQNKLLRLDMYLEEVQTNQRTAKQKEFLQETMLVLGAIIATIGTGILIWAFISVLYSFGLHSIWEWKAATPHKNAPGVQQALAIALKSLLSIGFFLLGTAIMFAPLGFYHAFLKSIQYKYRGIRGKLNKIFLRG